MSFVGMRVLSSMTPGTVHSVNAPVTVMRPMRPACSVNQSAPSGPTVSPRGPLLIVGVGNSLMTPAGVMRAILLW